MSLRNTIPKLKLWISTMLAGLANMTNRVTDPLGLELEFAEEKI